MKKILALLICTLLIFGITACGEEYADTNGTDDYTLQTITDEDIINLATGASGLGYRETNLGALKSSEYYSKNFNGVEQIYLTDFIMKSDVEIYIGHLNVESGNFRLCVINEDEIIFDVPLDSFGETYRFEDLKGTFAVHVAGESAKFEFYIEVQ